MVAALILLLAVGQTPQGETWIPARSIEPKGIDRATQLAVEEPWLACVRELPLPEAALRQHAPRQPWQLLRVHGADAPEVVTKHAATGTGWGAPTLLAIAADGAIVATWRPGHQVLVARPGNQPLLLDVHDDAGHWCAALSPTWIVHHQRETRALTARPIERDRIGERVTLANDGPACAEHVVFGAPWLAWSMPGGKVAAIDIERRERRTIALAIADMFVIDGIWNGHLLAHENQATSRVHVVDLEAGVAHALPAPAPVDGCVPEGVFTNGWLWDPVAGAVQRTELGPTPRLTLLRRAPGRLWLHKSRDADWRELRLDEAPVAVPATTPRLVMPMVPAPPDANLAEAARTAWRKTRS